MIIARRLAAAALAASLLAGFAIMPVSAQNVSVVVNGATVTFDQPPVERAGRVFVPLRGVFERLGASVVYANGVINAQGNGRSVHLQIGSTQATVNGQTLTMDVAPFVIGARTLVPLRFVAQSLGAAVNWSQSNNTVYIQGNGSAVVPPPNGNPATNVINRLNPAPNTHVGGTFTLSGHTRPGSAVHVVVTATASVLGGVIGVATGTNNYDAVANASGNFSVPVSINAVSGGSLRIAITSTSPTGAVAQRTVAYST
ncbi:MAG TPA: copper amine oxidase N-terminal domain-containing protein [Candidatus Rubrimentiphilum sp.]|nr:copper amine oxidase N-terminal domain-containing protein [Candidatus Rubrimentiphilum sp.]